MRQQSRVPESQGYGERLAVLCRLALRGASRLGARAMLSGVVIASVCLPALLTFVWFCEVLAGCFALRKERTFPVMASGTPSHRTAVLIPAHNEGAGILPTIRDTQAQLGPNAHILVVADNCTDDTVAIARAA